jgi:hypothetical protein
VHRDDRDRSTVPAGAKQMMTCRQNDRVTEWKMEICKPLERLVAG